jgi:ferric iron reductase protein FhuF
MREATEAHEALQRDLSTVCTGRFEPYRHRLAIETADTPELVSGQDLIGSNRLELVHEALARERDCADQRALFSLWVRMYGDVVIPAVLVANLVFDRDLPLSLDETRFAVDPDGKPRRLVLAHAGDRFPPDIAPAARFTRLIEGNLGPVVEAVSRQGRVSPRLLWGSLASYFEWTAHVLTTFFEGFSLSLES